MAGGTEELVELETPGGTLTALRGREQRINDETTPTPSSGRATPNRKFHLVWICLAGSVLLLSMVMEIRDSQQVNVPFTQIPMPELCSFRRFTGIDCAGCGMTRCFIALGHGDLSRAWNFNPAGILLYGIVLFQIPFRAWQLWRIRRGLPEVQLGKFGYGAMILFAVLMIAQWVIKQAALYF